MSEGRPRGCDYNVQAAGLALHALEPDEEIDLLAHIPGCASCQAVLDETAQVLAELGATVEQVDPPATLRRAILAEAARTVQARRPSAPERQGAAPEMSRYRRVVRRRAPRAPTRPQPGSARRRLVAAALLLVGIVAIGGMAVRSMQLTAERDAATAQVQTLAGIVTGLDQPGTQVATLAAPDGRVLAAVVVRDGRRTLVSTGDLAPNATDRQVYVLWGLTGGAAPQPVGTFDVPTPGAGIRPVVPEGGPGGYAVYAISLEPGRVAPTTPTAVLASGAVTA